MQIIRIAAPYLPVTSFGAQFSLRAIPKSALIWAASFIALFATLRMMLQGNFNLVSALVFFGILILASMQNKGLSIVLCFVYLFLLGDIRRILNLTGDVPKFDPLLLVGPIFSVVLALPILMGLRLRDPLAKAVTALMVVMVLEVANPKQGPIVVGIAGAMFYIIPLCWFWIGKRYGTYEMLKILLVRCVVPLSVLAAALGIMQTYVGFLPWERAWLDNVASHTNSFNLGGGFLRSFGFSVNGVEFASILTIGCTCCMALFFSGRRVYGLLVPLLAFAIFLSSSRGAVLRCVFGVAASWAISSRSGKGWVFRLLGALALGMAAIVFSAQQGATERKGEFKSAAEAASTHEVQGLAHPFDSKHSTAGTHSEMFLSGIMRGITYPIGYGLGSATLGSGKLGGDASSAGSSEVDLSDVFTTTGVVGGCIYVWMFVLILRNSIAFGRSAPKALGLPILGILFALLGEWLALGSYAMTPFVWLLIGALTRPMVSQSRPQQLISVRSAPMTALSRRMGAAGLPVHVST